MPRYLLRIEAVNFAASIDDTDDLSTRRGGGLMALNAATQFEEMMRSQIPTLKRIATGASIGLFTFEADDPSRVEQAVRDHFANGNLEYEKDGTKFGHLPLRHGTFVMAVEPCPDPAAEHRAAQLAEATVRWQQMQEPSLSLAGLWDGGGEACHFNCVRPATENMPVPDQPKPARVSPSVKDRRTYGRGARQRFYREAMRDTKLDKHFTNDFRSLADAQTGENQVPGIADNTHDKLAVIYLDGNDFGKKGRDAFRTGGTKAFGTWSDELRKHNGKLLSDLINTASGDRAWRYFSPNDHDRIRLETLLWGGDEILWVVPAWKGWEVAEWFFREKHEVLGQPLTYGCGLVFCHANATIGNITKLAHRLGDLAKAGRNKQNVHRLAYEVLESFDDVQGDLDAHRAKWLPKGVSPDVLLFNPADLAQCGPDLRAIAASADFPTRQLYRYCREWRRPAKGATDLDQQKDADTRAAEMANSLRRLEGSDVGKHFKDFIARFSSPEIGCLHLLQMLPYMPAAQGVPT